MSRQETPMVVVYDLNNKPHKMSHLNARDMLNHNKWSMTPIDRKALAAAQAIVDEEQDEQDELAAALNVGGKKVDTSIIERELDGKSKQEMIALALERFGAKIDGRKGEAEVISTIIELEAAELQKAPGEQAATLDENETGGDNNTGDDEEDEDEDE